MPQYLHNMFKQVTGTLQSIPILIKIELVFLLDQEIVKKDTPLMEQIPQKLQVIVVNVLQDILRHYQELELMDQTNSMLSPLFAKK